MSKRTPTNLEICREALYILDDFKGFDSCWHEKPERLPAVIATIVFQLLQNEEDIKNESI